MFYKPLTLIIFCLLLGTLKVKGQAPDTACYYINLDNRFHQGTHVLADFHLCLQYTDRLARGNQVKLNFLNWKRQVVGTYSLPKSYGSNSAELDLSSVGVWEAEKTYTISFTNEIGQKRQIPFKIILNEPDQPQVDIQANPLSLDCEAVEGNLVDFHGFIRGGKAPYQVFWQVLHDNGETHLFQPREDHIPKAGYTPTIQVTKSPSYYVMIDVFDACDQQAQQILYVSCEGKIEKNNTLFLKIINDKDPPGLDKVP